MARLQDDIQQLVDSFVPGETDPLRLVAELELPADQLTSHFRYETIVTALNATAPASVVPSAERSWRR